jgi:hypothetical protein
MHSVTSRVESLVLLDLVGATTLSITTFSIMTLSIKINNKHKMSFSIMTLDTFMLSVIYA